MVRMEESDSGQQQKRCSCGFWGSSQTSGLCSKCYKATVQETPQDGLDAKSDLIRERQTAYASHENLGATSSAFLSSARTQTAASSMEKAEDFLRQAVRGSGVEISNKNIASNADANSKDSGDSANTSVFDSTSQTSTSCTKSQTDTTSCVSTSQTVSTSCAGNIQTVSTSCASNLQTVSTSCAGNLQTVSTSCASNLQTVSTSCAGNLQTVSTSCAGNLQTVSISCAATQTATSTAVVTNSQSGTAPVSITIDKCDTSDVDIDLKTDAATEERLLRPSPDSRGTKRDSGCLDETTPESTPEKAGAKNKKRCAVCRCKLELAQRTIGRCRCDNVYCSLHRLPELHNCDFDHKEDGRREARQKMVKPTRHLGTSFKRLGSDS